MNRTFADLLAELQQLHDRRVEELEKANAVLRGELGQFKEKPTGDSASYAVGEMSCVKQPPTPRDDGQDNVTVQSRVRSRLAAITNSKASLSSLYPASTSLRRAPSLSGVKNPFRHCLYNWVHWEEFEIAIGVMIVANAITIGIDTSNRLANEETPEYIVILEYFFMSAYTAELGLRFLAAGAKALRNMWVRFDSFLVCCGFVDLFAQKLGKGGPVEVLDKIMLMRILRLARIARVFRLVTQFKTLWVLVQGMAQSLMTLFWTFVLVAIMIYTFAIFAVELLKQDEDASESYNIAIHENFSSLLSSCLTLCQGLTLDSIGAVYRPIILEKPFMCLYFVVFIMLVSISLMNLVTAILVESTMSFQQEHKQMLQVVEEAKKKTLLVKLHDIFTELDTDGSGELTFDELENASEEVQEHLQSIVSFSDWSVIFSALDLHTHGRIGIDDFCEGVLAALEGTPLELISIIQQLVAMREHDHELHRMVRSLKDSNHVGSRAVYTL